MALQLNGGLVPQWYTPKDTDPEDPTPPGFLLQPLTEVQTLEVMGDGIITDSGTFIPNHSARIKLLGWGIKNWRNINGPDGAPAECKRGSWQQLPWNLLAELATEILLRSSLREAERKNLPSQSASPETPAPLIATTASGDATVAATTPRPSQSG